MYTELKLLTVLVTVAVFGSSNAADPPTCSELPSIATADLTDRICNGSYKAMVSDLTSASVSGGSFSTNHYALDVTGLTVEADNDCMPTGKQTCDTIDVYVGTSAGDDGSPMTIEGVDYEGLVVVQCGTANYIFPVQEDGTTTAKISTPSADAFQTMIDNDATLDTSGIVVSDLVDFSDIDDDTKVLYYYDGTNYVMVFPELIISVDDADYTKMTEDQDTSGTTETGGVTITPNADCTDVFEVEFKEDDDGANTLKCQLALTLALPLLAWL